MVNVNLSLDKEYSLKCNKAAAWTNKSNRITLGTAYTTLISIFHVNVM